MRDETDVAGSLSGVQVFYLAGFVSHSCAYHFCDEVQRSNIDNIIDIFNFTIIHIVNCPLNLYTQCSRAHSKRSFAVHFYY